MKTSTVVSLRLPQDQASRLRRMARRMRRTASEVGAELVGEGLKRADFAFIEFRDSPVGRQAYIQGTRLTVWQTISVLRTYDGNAAKCAAHLQWPETKVHAAAAYAKAFPSEIEEAIKENEACDFEQLSRQLPGIQRFADLLKAKGRK